MGRLFENVTFDFQEEKRKAREEGREEGRKAREKELSIARRIARMSKECSALEIQEDIMKVFGLSKEEAKKEYQKVFEE